jgi:hypothetical protein
MTQVPAIWIMPSSGEAAGDLISTASTGRSRFRRRMTRIRG